MSPTDTSEKGLETRIVSLLIGRADAEPPGANVVHEAPAGYHAAPAAGYIEGDANDYDREHALDAVRLREFVQATQPKLVEPLGLDDADSPRRTRFLHRLQGEITRRGVVDVLRNGLRHEAHAVSYTHLTLPTKRIV